MIFKKRKYYTCVFITLFLIVLMTISAVIFIPIKKATVNAETEIEEETDDFFKDEIIEDNDETIEGEVDQSQNNVPEQKIINFTNAWSALKYALDMHENSPCYITYIQKITGGAKNLPVTVYSTISRKVYHNITEIYVINKPNTQVDVAGILNANVGVAFESHTYFDLSQGLVWSMNDKIVETLDQYLAARALATYEIPYVINKSTATVIGGLVNRADADYYEVQLQLKPDAYQRYLESMKKGIGLDKTPDMLSSRLTIRIDKKTGSLKSISADEKIQGSYTYESITAKAEVEASLTMEFTYTPNVAKAVQEGKNRINY